MYLIICYSIKELHHRISTPYSQGEAPPGSNSPWPHHVDRQRPGGRCLGAADRGGVEVVQPGGPPRRHPQPTPGSRPSGPSSARPQVSGMVGEGVPVHLVWPACTLFCRVVSACRPMFPGRRRWCHFFIPKLAASAPESERQADVCESI